MSESIERISEMETIMEECGDAIASLSAQLNRMDALRDKMIRLFKYYGSKEWYEDRDLTLPDGMKAGVLSEDLVYDEIADVRDSAFHMMELAVDILKNRI